jgi:hypothetical protein
MHPSTITEDKKSAIEQLEHTVLNIHNIQQQWTNTPLSLFFIDLKPQDNNKDVYHKETLNCIKVQFEPRRPKRTTPQCAKCQRYGHTKAATTAPGASNALVLTAPQTAHVKNDQIKSSASYAAETTRQITKVALYTKNYNVPSPRCAPNPTGLLS